MLTFKFYIFAGTINDVWTARFTLAPMIAGGGLPKVSFLAF
jgi:hypothetical protein